MRFFIFIFVCTSLVSCVQNTKTENTQDKKIVTASIDTVEISDSMYLMHMVKNDSAWLFDSPDLQSTKKKLLLKDESIQELKRKGSFVYGFYYSSPTDTVKGWAFLDDFVVIRFTPPIIDSSQEEK